MPEKTSRKFAAEKEKISKIFREKVIFYTEFAVFL